MAVPSNVPASKNLNTFQDNLKRLNTELEEAEERLELFLLRLKGKNIEPPMLNRPAYEGLPTAITLSIEKLTEQPLVYSNRELDQQVDDLKKSISFPKTA